MLPDSKIKNGTFYYIKMEKNVPLKKSDFRFLKMHEIMNVKMKCNSKNSFKVILDRVLSPEIIYVFGDLRMSFYLFLFFVTLKGALCTLLFLFRGTSLSCQKYGWPSPLGVNKKVNFGYCGYPIELTASMSLVPQYFILKNQRNY